jgi:guanosine-3',5'-bis(diphosphate) 3'-pyrophosphohydrolase
MVIKHKTSEQKIKSEFETFILENKQRFESEENIELLRKAFKFAFKAHKNMVRYNGDPYITHPLEVARIVTEKLGLGTTSAVAAILHDVPNKTEYDTEDIKRYFGDKIYSIVNSLKKIKNTEYFENHAQASILRQILLQISDDIRVIFIKIADKLHNIRTVEFLPQDRQKKVIEDILNIYAPLSHRLGLYEIKADMEDICLKNTNPYIYDQIQEKLKSSERERIQFINRFVQPIKEKLDNKNIEYEISGRPKSIYSIWKKMQQKAVPLEEIYDLFAVRIIFEPSDPLHEDFEALQIGSMITALYAEKKDRKRNWLRTGKDTGYRALHITVMSDEGQWVEVQIRSKEMHEAAEYGLAAHWKYKGLKEKKTEFDEKVRELLEYLSEDNSNAATFIDNLKLNLFTTEIYVFTPKGDVINLPKGASVLDFAFKIHTDLAMKCIAGKINGKTQSVDTILKNGDQVEIITTKKQKPEKDWLEYVITQRALYALKKHFKADIENNIKAGKDKLEKLIRDSDGENVGKCIENISKHMLYRNKEKMFEHIGEGIITDEELQQTVKRFCVKQRSTRFWKIKRPSKDYKDQDDLPNNYIIGKCCNPVPGNEIIGIKDDFNENKIIIHKKQCYTAITEIALKKKPVAVNWSSYTAISLLNELIIKGTNEPGIINKITSVISIDLSVNIKSIRFDTYRSNFTAEIKVYAMQENFSEIIMKQLKKIPAIKSIEVTG